LLGCYRRDDAADPETYAAAVAAVLSTYPPDIVKRVTDPRTGLPGKSKFLPTVSEVREECERLAMADAASIERQQSIERQLAERKAEEESRAARPRPTIEELKEKYGPNWGLSVPEEDLEAKQRQREQIERANKVLFEREGAGNQWASAHLVELVQRQMQSGEAAE
jgi:hypothetical protein